MAESVEDEPERIKGFLSGAGIGQGILDYPAFLRPKHE